MGDNEVVINQPMGPGWYFVPGYFFDNQGQHPNHQVPIDWVEYSTMKSTDLALLRLGVTYGEMRVRGFEPLQLKPMTNTEGSVETAHVPFGLFPDRFLRHSSCNARRLAVVYEADSADSPWFFRQDLPTDCIGVYGGSSGAPLMSANQSGILGVLSVTNDSPECIIFAACEVHDGIPVTHPGSVYVASANRLIPVLRPDGTLDLSTLDPGTGIGLQQIGSWSTPFEPTVPAQWNVEVDPSYALIRFKTGVADHVECSDAKGYSEPLRASDQPLLTLKVNAKVGVYAVCVVGKRSANEDWQKIADASIKVRELSAP
jgi:hypothetical protein